MPRAQREQLILEIAGDVFARDGYHAASMDEISRQAGVSKPMLYAYFGSKEGLYVAYIDCTGQQLVERLQRTFAGPGQASVHLRVSEFLEFVEHHRNGWKILFSEASSSRPVAEEVAQLRRRITSAVTGLVREGVGADAVLEGQAASAVAHAIVGAGESLANWWLERPEVDRERLADWYVAAIYGTVAAVTRAG